MEVTVMRRLRRPGSNDIEQNPMVKPGTVIDMEGEELEHFVNSGAVKLGNHNKAKDNAEA